MVTYLFAQVYNQQEGVTVHRLQKEKATHPVSPRVHHDHYDLRQSS